MTLTLTIDEQLEQRLAQAAGELGLSVEQYALRVLSGGRSTTPASGRELVEQWRAGGVIGSRPDIDDSSAHARRLRQAAERRHGSR